MKVAQWRRWLWSVGSYTAAGVVSSAAIGWVLGWLGSALVPAPFHEAAVLVGVLLAVVAICRELGVLRFRLPQAHRQTSGWLGNRIPPAIVPAAWGFDIGLTFATWLGLGGALVLGALAIAIGSPEFGGALFVAHWIGRAASVWVAPAWAVRSHSTGQLLDAIHAQGHLVSRVHAGGIALAAAAALLVAR